LQKPDRGAEGKADTAAGIGGISTCHKILLAFGKAGLGKKASMKRLNTSSSRGAIHASPLHERYGPHGCKQYGFASATLKSLDSQNRSVPGPATNLEIIQKFLFDMSGKVSYIPKSPFRIG